MNTIDVKTANARGVFVTNCPGKNSIAVAELVFALLLGIDRRIAENVTALRAHQWNKKEFSKADGVFGKTLGIVGVGQIGREVIKRAQAFGLHVIAWSLTPAWADDLGVEWCAEVDDVFRRADIVSLHVALKPDTKHLVNAERLALLKPNAILINAARGEVVDQAALRVALAAKKRFGPGWMCLIPSRPGVWANSTTQFLICRISTGRTTSGRRRTRRKLRSRSKPSGSLRRL